MVASLIACVLEDRCDANIIIVFNETNKTNTEANHSKRALYPYILMKSREVRLYILPCTQ